MTRFSMAEKIRAGVGAGCDLIIKGDNFYGLAGVADGLCRKSEVHLRQSVLQHRQPRFDYNDRFVGEQRNDGFEDQTERSSPP